ncbi:F-box/LRR-repeat protein At4g14103-like [Carex rostrata]
MGSIDRISDLPDPLLHHIMSFLESQEVVQTCVLSKRWKNLWASLQCLHLDLSKFEVGENRKGQFTNFVNTLLLLRDTSDLQTFRLKYRDDDAYVYKGIFMSWILYAIKRNAKVIEIDVTCYVRLPQCMFNSPSLEELNLCVSSIDHDMESRAINLPRLKKLELHGESYDSEILNKLALGCPALEDLYLNECLIDISVVSFPKLKYLNINSSWAEDMRVGSISAPNLVSLTLVGCTEIFGEMSLEKMPSLMNATIDLWGGFPMPSLMNVEKCNLLRAVVNVQNLELYGSTIQDLFEIELPRCPTFFNLTTLSLRAFCMICDSSDVGDFLKRTPNLKKITLCRHCYKKRKSHSKADQGSNSMKSALFQCKKLDEIEVELQLINVRTKQLVNALVESLAELKTTRLVLSFHCTSLTEFHQSCLSMVQGKNVVTFFRCNKFVVCSK